MNFVRSAREAAEFAHYLAGADLHTDWTVSGALSLARLLADGRKDLYAMLPVHAANTPEKPAIVEGGRITTYAELQAEACRFGNALARAGVRRRDKVVLALGNSTEAVAAAAGVSHLGAMVVPCSTSYKEKELTHVVEHSDAKVVCLTRKQASECPSALNGRTVVLREEWQAFLSSDARQPKRQWRQRDADVMMYTSGTTGKPKGAMLNMHKVAYYRAYQVLGACGFNKYTRFYTACPTYHAAPTAFIGFTLTVGGTVYLDDKFDAQEVWKFFAEAGITNAFMVPTQIVRLLACDLSARPPSLERILSGGAALPAPVKERALAQIGPVYDFYGATELGLVSIGDPKGMRAHPGSIGRPFPGVDVRFLDDDGEPVPVGTRGVLFVTSDQFDFGYYKNADATASSFTGKYRTVGDIGYQDQDGFLYVVDRKSDMLVSGGVNIYPAEIENELLEHPKIEDAAVVGMPDDEWGEAVVAFVVVRPGEQLSAAEVVAYCEGRLSKQKKPKRVELVAELPRSPQGKVLKRVLRDRLTVGNGPSASS